VKSQVRDKVRNNVCGIATGQVDSVYWKVWDQVEDHVWNQVRNHVYFRLKREINDER
jgi:hypothetical protein